MKIELISVTPNALELLLYTKQTRLQGEQTLNEIINTPMDEKLDDLSYVKDTIKSSWEFVTYVFKISGVSRAFTHQLVRTRNASYAQETQRAVDVRDNKWIGISSDKYSEAQLEEYDNAMQQSMNWYEHLIENGLEIQDARGVIPTNISTSIIAKFDLRELHKMAELRLCTRTQGEYQKVFEEMKREVVKVHPWAEDMIQVFCANHGSCAFPRFTECPIQQFTFNSHPEKLNEIKERIKTEHRGITFAANPVAVGGRTDGK